MGKQDQWVIIILILLIVIHFAVWAVGFITNRLLFFITVLNLISGSSIIIYWIQKQLRIQQHILEQREIFVLLLEIVMVGCAICFFSNGRWTNYFKVVQYLFFAVHLLLLVAGLVFLLTFKMNRLI